MKVLRVRHGDAAFYAQLVVENSTVVCLDRALGLPDPIPLAEVAVLPPVTPSKIICAAGNFRSRLREMGREAADAPMLFLKPPSAVIGSGQAIVLPQASARVDAEGELALVIGRACRNLAAADVAKYLFGYACAGDVTAVDLRALDETLGRAKGFDTFAPIGPWIETEVDNPTALGLRMFVNGQLVQEGNTSDMVVSPFALVSFVSSIMTLLPGDVILSGSPAGPSPITPGDEVRVEIDGVGVLINPVRAEPEATPLQ
ncbi:fumarylacetoacetate hydrolase family protein [Desulfovibrio sp. TomC]|uniref:fumarylacetoacetate hydrolase family protein n=1 Tax=Desulfovibrio sp. TomC TaxID=1562888 RepID=UPI000574B0C1|nr:fumarylacetoacetate hydrolase family protein [Desulfovibrio sp. TomC]KHK03775.1 putative 2-keto-4-pentenoate hydratase/2-oxohepta-3-ene-1,7-dioic acid hydratase [Desulfovibrio sp. TomC]